MPGCLEVVKIALKADEDECCIAAATAVLLEASCCLAAASINVGGRPEVAGIPERKGTE